MSGTEESTYGVEVSDFGDTSYYLGNDEVLWDWAEAPLPPFTEDTMEVSLPAGYVLMEGEYGEPLLAKGVPAAGRTTVTVTIGSAYEDKIQVLTSSMKSVSRREFDAAGLSDERIVETVAY